MDVCRGKVKRMFVRLLFLEVGEESWELRILVLTWKFAKQDKWLMDISLIE